MKSYSSDYNNRPSQSVSEMLVENLKDLLTLSPVRIMLAATLMGGTFFGVSYNKNSKKAAHIPVAYAQRRRTADEFGELNQFYSNTNNLTMSVFEAHNKSYKHDNKIKGFAEELKEKMGSSADDNSINAYAKSIPQHAKGALDSLRRITGTTIDLATLNGELKEVWGEYHHNNYHTEFYTTTSCNGKGQCHTTLHSRQVYDNTDHAYTYHPERGAQAASLLNGFVARHDNISVKEHLLRSDDVSAENKEIIRESHLEFQDSIPTPEQYAKLANTWVDGSNLNNFLPVANARIHYLKAQAPQLDDAQHTAHSAAYRTTQRSDDGPQEFQLVHAVNDNVVTAANSIHKIENGIATASTTAPALAQKAQDFIDVALNNKEGDAEKLADDVLDTATQLYKQNFEKGADVEPFKWGDIATWTVVGAVAGAGVGAVTDKLLNDAQDRREYSEWRDRYNTNNRFRI